VTAIGVVGAGGGGAALSYGLERAAPEVSITVLEKSGGVCGRAATRRHGEVTYDYGANYLKSGDERVNELITETLDTAGLIDVTEPVWTFDAAGTVTEGRDADDHKWSYRRGLTQIAKRLFARTDAAVHRHTRVEVIARDGERWRVIDDDGNEYGPFDVLALNPPAPQTAELLGTADWDRPLRETLASAAAGVPYRSVYSAVLHYPFSLDRPYYALVNTDKDHAVGWISREECKPGHVPDGETVLVVQASPEWSVGHRDRDPAENVAALAEMTASLVDDQRLRDPGWTDHQNWRYALPEAGVDPEPVRRAESRDLYCIGDWVAGEARLHAALRAGLDAADRIADGR